MSCDPRRPCANDGTGDIVLGLQPPVPGQAYLHRRVGDFADFVADLVRTVETTPAPDGHLLGRTWDVEGDPRAQRLARLWAYVADGVAAYTELTANEAYLPTALDWTDLRRIAALVGHRPRPPVAARGWLRVLTDKGAAPLVPAGTRVQAPAVPGVRDAQVFETVEDTQLRADWAGLTVTPVPEPATPGDDRTLRFLQDPGFSPGDRVLFVLEEGPSVPLPTGTGWFAYWIWILLLYAPVSAPTKTPVAVAVVTKRTTDLGTVVVTFDRDLSELLSAPDKSYAAYRITANAGSARRISKVLKLAATDSFVSLSGTTLGYSGDPAVNDTSLVLDATVETVSAQQQVVVVDWQVGACDVVAVSGHRPVEWEVAPGAPSRVTRLDFAAPVGTLQNAKLSGRPVTAYFVDRRVSARHYVIPSRTAPTQLRVFPAPALAPVRLAVRSETADGPRWEVFDCSLASTQESSADPSAPRGLVLDLVGGAPAGEVGRAPAAANLVAVSHGETASRVLGGGDATVPSLSLAVPTGPVTSDLGPDGTPVPSLVVRVDGLRWDEVPTLYGAGRTDVYTTVLSADGGVTVRFGDGQSGRRPVTGRDNITATYRVGGGTAGEVPSGAITSLVGSIRGVQGVLGVGPTSGGADLDDESRARQLAPGRARTFGRAVSMGDLRDIALGYPGVSHAASWRGAGPPGCSCAGSGLHVAFLRRTGADARAPEPTEVASLAAYLDARRDTEVPLCVAGGTVTPVVVEGTVMTDPRRDQPVVVTAVDHALVARDGPLGAWSRTMGQPLDRSDVIAVVHAVDGVVGLPTLTLSGVAGDDVVIGRRAAARYELLVVDPVSHLTGVQ